MFEYVDYMKCKHCGSTNCLFKLRVDRYYKKITGNIRYKVTSTCKMCYLEDCMMKNDRHAPKHRESSLARQRLFRVINKEAYNKRARGYYQKRREAVLAQKRNKYILKIRTGLLNDAKERTSICLNSRTR